MLKYIIPAICGILTFGMTACSKTQKPEDPEKDTNKIITRILSYNTFYCKGNNPATTGIKAENVKQFAEAMNALNADIIALQELDSGFKSRENGRFLLADINRYTGDLYQKYYGSAQEFPSEKGSVGVGVLLKKSVKVLNVKKVALPGDEKRVLLMIELEKFWFIATHFDLVAQNRSKSVEILTEELKKLNKPVILAGDLNDVMSSGPIKSIQLNFDLLSMAKPSFVGSTSTIDYIFSTKNFSRKLKIVNKEIPQTLNISGKTIDLTKVSDHLPVWVDVYLPD